MLKYIVPSSWRQDPTPWWQHTAPRLYQGAMLSSGLIASPQCFLGGFLLGLLAGPVLQTTEESYPNTSRVVRPVTTILKDTEQRMPKNALMAHTIACCLLPWFPLVGFAVSFGTAYWAGIRVRQLVWPPEAEGSKFSRFFQ